MELRDPRGGWAFSEIEICRIMGWTDTKMIMRYASIRGEDLAARMVWRLAQCSSGLSRICGARFVISSRLRVREVAADFGEHRFANGGKVFSLVD